MDVKVAVGAMSVGVDVSVGMLSGVGAGAQETRNKSNRKSVKARFIIRFFTAKARRAQRFKNLGVLRAFAVYLLDPAALDHCRADLFFQLIRFGFIALQLGEHLFPS